MTLPNFSVALPCLITNYLTNAQYSVQRVDKIAFEREHYAQITDICNEPRIYDLLFRERRRGVPYRHNDARGFVEWGQGGWQKGQYYLFFVMTADNQVAAALDVKSSDLVSSEIGYWCSENHRGLMTNAVAGLTNLMAQAGYVKAHALVLPTNALSANVLLRNNFELLGPFERDGVTFNKYNKVLFAT